MAAVRMSWFRVRHWIEDYPVLATLFALVLVCIVPYIQYQAWVSEGVQLGEAAFNEGKYAFGDGKFQIAVGKFKGALDYYERPLIFDPPQAMEVTLHLAQVYQIRARLAAGDSRRSFLTEAIGFYRELMYSRTYSPEGLAGLEVLLGELQDDDLRAAVTERKDRYSEESLAAALNDRELEGEAARYCYSLGDAYLFQFDFENARGGYERAWDLSPEYGDQQDLDERVISGEAMSHVWRGDDQMALRVCLRYLAEDFESFPAHSCLAKVHQALGHHQVACHEYDTIAHELDQSSEDGDLRTRAAKAYYSCGQQQASYNRLEEAIRAYERACELGPGDYAAACQATRVTLTISGDVENLDSEPVAGAQVRILGQDVGGTDEAGHFEVETDWLSIGQLLVEVESETGDFYHSYLDIAPSESDYNTAVFPDYLERILIYSDEDDDGNYLIEGLDALGLEYVLYQRDAAAFIDDLTTGGAWGLVVISQMNTDGMGDYWDDIMTFLRANPTVAIVETYTADEGDFKALLDYCHVFWEAEISTGQPVYWHMPDHPIFTIPNVVPEFEMMSDRWADDGDELATGVEGRMLAGLRWGDDTRGVVTLCPGERVLLNTFLLEENVSDLDSDGILDGVELWMNEVSYMLPQAQAQAQAPWEIHSDAALTYYDWGLEQTSNGYVNAALWAYGRAFDLDPEDYAWTGQVTTETLTISGDVNDPEGEAVAGAQVRILDRDVDRTDDSGTFEAEVEFPSVGRLPVEIDIPGIGPARLDLGIALGQTSYTLTVEYPTASNVAIYNHAAGDDISYLAGENDNNWAALATILGPEGDIGAGATVFIDPQSKGVGVGDETTVDIRISNVADLFGAEVHLDFDPALLEVVDADADMDGVQIQPGTFLNAYFTAQNGVDQAAGKIDFAIGQGPGDQPASGSGVLATVSFKGKMAGTSVINFRNVILADRDGMPIGAERWDGRVAVTMGGTITPAATSTVDVVTELSDATLANYDCLVLPDNAVPDEYLDEVEAWFRPGTKIIAIDSAVSYLAYSGFLWSDSAGSSGEDRFWEYSQGTVQIAAESDLTAAYSVGQPVVTIPDRDWDAWLYARSLPADAAALAVSASDSNLVAIATRDVPNRGTLVFIGPNQSDRTELEPLIRYAVTSGSPESGEVVPRIVQIGREVGLGEASATTTGTIHRRLDAYPDGEYHDTSLGQTVAGTISEVGEADIYVFKGTGGQQFVFDVDAQSLGSSLDSTLELWNQDDEQLASSDDSDGYDSRIIQMLPDNGDYYVVVQDLNNAAGEDHFYQLHLNPVEMALDLNPADDELCTTAARNYYSWGQQKTLEGELEAVIQAYQRAYELAPDNPDYEEAAQATEVTLTISGDARNLAGEAVAGALVRIAGRDVGETDDTGHFETEIEWLSVSELLVEVESADGGTYRSHLNVVPGKANYTIAPLVSPRLRAYPDSEYAAIDLQQVISGTIGTVGEADVYVFEGIGGQQFVFDVDARSLGSPLDSTLELWSEEDLRLAYSDDSDGHDSRITRVLPYTGVYFIVVGDAGSDSGGDSHFYELRVNTVEDELRSMAAHNYYLWGQEKALEGELEAAIQAYQRASELAPDNPGYEQMAQATVVTLTISGSVRNLAGEALVGAQVRILGQAVGETNRVGHFETEIEWLSVGELLVEIESVAEGVHHSYFNIVPGETNYAIAATFLPSLRILAWTAYTDMDEEYAYVLDALSRLAPVEYDLTETTTTDASTLESALTDQDVFLVPEQEGANTEILTEIGFRLGPVLGEFVRQGGRVISLGEWQDRGGFLKAMGLLDASYITGIYPGVVSLVDSGSPIAQGLPTGFDAENGTGSYTIADADATVVAKSADGNAVVATRSIGLGQVIIIGYDYYESNVEADRLLVNAIFWPR